MTVIEMARTNMTDAQKQAALGSESALSDMIYWAAYLDGARAQRNEDERLMAKYSGENHKEDI